MQSTANTYESWPGHEPYGSTISCTVGTGEPSRSRNCEESQSTTSRHIPVMRQSSVDLPWDGEISKKICHNGWLRWTLNKTSLMQLQNISEKQWKPLKCNNKAFKQKNTHLMVLIVVAVTTAKTKAKLVVIKVWVKIPQYWWTCQIRSLLAFSNRCSLFFVVTTVLFNQN